MGWSLRRISWIDAPNGQPLYITDGIGLVATCSALHEIRPGDVIYIEPSEEHCHGATPDRFMAHIAVQEPRPQAMMRQAAATVNRSLRCLGFSISSMSAMAKSSAEMAVPTGLSVPTM